MKKLLVLAALFCFAGWGFGCDKTKVATAKVQGETPAVTASATASAAKAESPVAGTEIKGHCAPKTAKAASCCSKKAVTTAQADAAPAAPKAAKAVKAAKQGDI